MKKGQLIATAAAGLLAVGIASGITGCTNGTPGLNCPNSCKGMSACKSVDAKDAGVMQEVKEVKKAHHHKAKKRHHKKRHAKKAAKAATEAAPAAAEEPKS